MKKLLVFVVITSLYWQPTIVFAQKKNKAERAFVTELNTVLNKSEKQDGDYEGVMNIDSAFAINAAGVLTVTVKYTSDSSITRVRLAAPVSSIQKVLYDLYLILECADEQVHLFEAKNNEPLKEVSKGSWFHVGAPLPEDMVCLQRAQKRRDTLKKH